LQVREIMNERVVTIQADQSLVEALRILLTHGITSAPVVDASGHLVGMVGLKDGLRAPHPSQANVMIHRHTTLEERARALDTTRVGMVMARPVITVTPETPVEEAAAVMSNRGRHPLPVVEGGRIVGVISRSDIIRALLALRDLSPAPGATCQGEIRENEDGAGRSIRESRR
jgi:CBS domain-containing protein